MRALSRFVADTSLMGYLQQDESFLDPKVVRRVAWRWLCDRPMTCVWIGWRVVNYRKRRW